MILLEMFQYGFMQRAFAAGVVIGVLLPLLGVFLVTRRYALIADTLSHISLAGVAAGVLLGVSPVLAAIVAAVLGALGIEALRTRRIGQGEAVLSLFLSGSLAAAILLFGLADRTVNVEQYLFGSITTVSPTDVVLITVLGIIGAALIALTARQQFLLSLDEELARASGIRAGLLNALLVTVSAVAVALAMRVVGILLTGALMVIPVLAASQLAASFRQTGILAIAFSLASVVVGLILSYILDLSSGGTIVFVALGIFAISAVARRKN